MKVLLTRFGGIGDGFPIMVAANQLKKRGHEVTIALRDDGGSTRQTLLWENQKDFAFIDYEEVGPWKSRVFSYEAGLIEPVALYKNYDLVVDFMNIVEGNSTSPVNNMKEPWEFWQRSRSSNYQNWYDLHLAWCGIDPTSVPDDEKRPKLVLTEEEQKVSDNFKAPFDKVFVVSPFASSLSRSWYQADKLIEPLLKEYPNCGIAFWDPTKNIWRWISNSGKGFIPKLSFSPLRETMILINASDLVIGVDTGVGHMAEALDRKSLIIYSTVPAWTRNKYYKFQAHIDPGESNPEYYTFSLGLGDPLRVKDGIEALSENDKKLKELIDRKADLEEIAEALNTDSRGAELQAKMFGTKIETWERTQSKALSSVTPEVVFERIKGIING